MSRPRTKEHKYGDRFNVYISDLVDEELLSFINKQKDLTAAVMAGLIKLYQEYGNIDLVNFIPRTYSVNAYIPPSNVGINQTEEIEASSSVSNEAYSPKPPKTEQPPKSDDKKIETQEITEPTPPLPTLDMEPKKESNNLSSNHGINSMVNIAKNFNKK